MIQHILCDVGNVIVLAEHTRTHQRLIELGVDPAVAALFFQIPAYADFARGRITAEEFYCAERMMLGVWSLTFDQIREAHDVHMYSVDKGVIEVLKTMTCPITFATDTNEWQTAREGQLVDLTTLGSQVIRSNEIGKLKRDPGCFDKILELLDGQSADRIDPRSVLFIDDSPEKIDKAIRRGMSTHIFTTAQSLRRALPLWEYQRH